MITERDGVVITVTDRLVLGSLYNKEVQSIDGLLDSLPTLTWAQVFSSVDRLSRRGLVILQKVGYEYLVRTTKDSLTRPDVRSLIDGVWDHQPAGRDERPAYRVGSCSNWMRQRSVQK